MRQIVNLIAFLGIFFLFYLAGLPKKAKGLLSHLHAAHSLTEDSRRDSVESVVENRIREDLCPIADLSEYRAGEWSEFGQVDPETSSITHAFTCDNAQRKFLFRVTNGIVTEIIDLR